MRPFVLGLLLLVPSLLAAAPSDTDREKTTAWAKSLDKETVRNISLAHETDPLSPESRDRWAPLLLAHFEGVPFVVCLDQVPGVSDEGNLGKALLWQIVFGSGVFLEEHPEAAQDREAYMTAGLQSAVRAYRNVLTKNPQMRIPVFDQLDELDRQNRLVEHVRAHDCQKKK
ncbi:MAG TPA: hypothetical protein VFV75_13785 [Candidatus Polarisedimenticolaceae bacterium]|nr:hypothetical protein [Candidatus Polarisedimenticolaceae bacterium]